MAMAVASSGEGRGRRRGVGPAVAISLVVHLAFFLAVGLIVPKPRLQLLAPEPPVQVILIPQLEPERVERPPPPRTKAQSAERPPPIAIPHIHIPRTQPLEAEAPTVAAAPSPSPAPPGNGRVGTSNAPGNLPYEEGERGVRAFLRATVGCETPDALKLTPAERARCDQRFGEQARNAHPLGALDYGRHGNFGAPNTRDEIPSHPIVACTGQGSNFGVGCLQDGADKSRSP